MNNPADANLKQNVQLFSKSNSENDTKIPNQIPNEKHQEIFYCKGRVGGYYFTGFEQIR